MNMDSFSSWTSGLEQIGDHSERARHKSTVRESSPKGRSDRVERADKRKKIEQMDRELEGDPERLLVSVPTPTEQSQESIEKQLKLFDNLAQGWTQRLAKNNWGNEAATKILLSELNKEGMTFFNNCPFNVRQKILDSLPRPFQRTDGTGRMLCGNGEMFFVEEFPHDEGSFNYAEHEFGNSCMLAGRAEGPVNYELYFQQAQRVARSLQNDLRVTNGELHRRMAARLPLRLPIRDRALVFTYEIAAGSPARVIARWE